MKHTLTLIAALLATIVPARAADLVLASKDTPPVPIIVFKDAPPRTRDAVVTLAEYIGRISGKKPEVLDGEPNLHPIQPEGRKRLEFFPCKSKLLSIIMKPGCVIASVVCLSFLVEAVTATEREITLLDSIEDTFIASDVADLNMGGMSGLNLGAFGKDGLRKGRLLVKFDPAAAGVSRDARVNRVILRLNWKHFLFWDPENVIRVHRVLKPWRQGAGSYTAANAGEATWKAARHGEENWGIPGCSGASDRSAGFVERVAKPYNIDFDVTELYEQWRLGESTNAISFLVDADSAGQKPSDPVRGEYQAVLESSESDEAPGVSLILVQGEDPPRSANQPIWSVGSPAANGQPEPAQFGFIRDGVFYGASYNGHVYKIEMESGKLLAEWEVSSGGCYSAPLMVDGKLYLLAKDKRFYRLDENPEPKAVVLADFANEANTTRVESLAYDHTTKLFYLGTGSAVHAVDSSGKEHWAIPHANAQWGEPMACDGTLYTYDTSSGKVLKYRATGEGAPALEWECEIGFGTAELARGVDADGDRLIFVSAWKFARPGSITAVHDEGAAAGTPKWGPIPLPHTVKHCSISEKHDLLLLPAQNGFVECRRASTGEFVKRITIVDAAEAATPWSQVVVSGDYAIVTTHETNTEGDNFLYVYDIPSGKEIWRSAPFPGAVGCMIPAVSNGVCVVGTYAKGTWHAFRIGEGRPVEFSRFANGEHNGQAHGALEKVSESLR